MATTQEWIISEIKRIAAETGTPPGQKAFESATGVHQWDWRGRFWAKWSDALADAGFAALAWNTRADDSTVLDSLVREVRRIGHFPSRAELMMRRRTDPSFPAETTLRRRGNRSTLIRLSIEYCEDHQDDWADVLAILEPLVISEPPGSVTEGGGGRDLISGYVYLIKSGGKFKIGHSSDVQRRMVQLNTGMPEAGELVHTISTDDPVGIERYWHQRFSDRRIRPDAEWFELTADDVRSFKRRKFQ